MLAVLGMELPRAVRRYIAGPNAALIMRVFLGMILGALLTITAAYIYDSGRADQAGIQRTMVNWDVVSENWQAAKARVQREWTQLSSRLNT